MTMSQLLKSMFRPQALLGVIAVGGGLAALGLALDPVQGVDPGASARISTTSSAGASSDSNQDMIAVTGVDVTGVSVLYLIDTKTKHLAVYQASGGSGGSQGIRLVGARNIGLDLQLDGFNDKTETKGRPLRYKDLEKKFSGLDESSKGKSK
ncbi:MAG: hypothetical protein JKY61_01605 [Planctomycetes bacterium]|nr:hypothetical protein [Planctomycetota bacterium]